MQDRRHHGANAFPQFVRSIAGSSIFEAVLIAAALPSDGKGKSCKSGEIEGAQRISLIVWHGTLPDFMNSAVRNDERQLGLAPPFDHSCLCRHGADGIHAAGAGHKPPNRVLGS